MNIFIKVFLFSALLSSISLAKNININTVLADIKQIQKELKEEELAGDEDQTKLKLDEFKQFIELKSSESKTFIYDEAYISKLLVAVISKINSNLSSLKKIKYHRISFTSYLDGLGAYVSKNKINALVIDIDSNYKQIALINKQLKHYRLLKKNINIILGDNRAIKTLIATIKNHKDTKYKKIRIMSSSIKNDKNILLREKEYIYGSIRVKEINYTKKYLEIGI